VELTPGDEDREDRESEHGSVYSVSGPVVIAEKMVRGNLPDRALTLQAGAAMYEVRRDTLKRL